MNDPRLKPLMEVLTRFIERISWFRPFADAEEPWTLEALRSVLDEWEQLEPHLELLEAIGGSERMATLLLQIEQVRAQVRMTFLLAVGKLLQVTDQYWTNEMLMQVPIALKKLPPGEKVPAHIAAKIDKLRGMLKEWPEPEVMFRESMRAADACEPVMTALHKALLDDWPVEWTPSMQTRLEHLQPDDMKVWRDELRHEAAELEQKYPGLIKLCK
jgi:hypothetical protein